MAVLTIRNLPDQIHNLLRVRAASAGRSMEAEVRSILSAVCLDKREVISPTDLQNWVDALYGKKKPRKVAAGLIKERRRESADE